MTSQPMPHSHQGLNTFKSCLVKHSLKLPVSFIKAAFGFLLIFVEFKATNQSCCGPLKRNIVFHGLDWRGLDL